MANARQNKEFTDHMLPGSPLDDAIEWISSSMEPEDVFSEKQLAAWAENNDYVKSEG